MKHILMVDDVATNLKCAGEILKDEYEITTAKSGEKAFLLMKEKTPDLILLDINMPDMNGFEVFEKLKSDSEFSKIPVVFCTAEINKEAEIKGFEMGAADFIRKPYIPEVLCSRIKRVLEDYELREEKKAASEVPIRKNNCQRLADKADSRQVNGYFLLFRIDNFKRADQLFGSAAGDEIIKRAVRVFEEKTGSDGCVCHIDGDLFAGFLEGIQEKARSKILIRRIIAGIEFEINEGFQESFGSKLTLSVGIAGKPKDGKSFSSLKECADKALYYVDQNRNQSYHFYHTEQSEWKEMTEEKERIMILQFRKMFSGKEEERSDGWENLQRAYRLFSHCGENVKKNVQLVLFQVSQVQKREDEREIAVLLDEVISGFLRKGDIVVKSGWLQYLVLLMNTSCENGEMAAKRIQKRLEEKTEGKSLCLEYIMKSI